MNEKSSIFIDVVTKNLITEKLKFSYSQASSGQFAQFEKIPDFIENINTPTQLGITFTDENFDETIILKSSIESPFDENNKIHLGVKRAEKSIGSLLFIHGLFDDNINSFKYLFRLLNLWGLDIYFFNLPYHFDRSLENSQFSGQSFISGDAISFQNTIVQTIADIKISLEYLKSLNMLPSIICGYSLGGCVASACHLLLKNCPEVFLINPVISFSEVYINNIIYAKFNKNTENIESDIKKVKELFFDLDPLNIYPQKSPTNNIDIAYGIYDQIVCTDDYKRLTDALSFRQTHVYNTGHLNTLQIPRLATDIFNYFKEISFISNPSRDSVPS